MKFRLSSSDDSGPSLLGLVCIVLTTIALFAVTWPIYLGKLLGEEGQQENPDDKIVPW